MSERSEIERLRQVIRAEFGDSPTGQSLQLIAIALGRVPPNERERVLDWLRLHVAKPSITEQLASAGVSAVRQALRNTFGKN